MFSMREQASLYEEGELDSLLSPTQANHEVCSIRRFEFSPYLKNLHGKKVIYRERIAGIACAFNPVISNDGFSCELVPLYLIEKKRGWMNSTVWTVPITIYSAWSCLRLEGSRFSSSPYSGWSLWPEQDLVQEVEFLLNEGSKKEALELLEI